MFSHISLGLVLKFCIQSLMTNSPNMSNRGLPTTAKFGGEWLSAPAWLSSLDITGEQYPPPVTVRIHVWVMEHGTVQFNSCRALVVEVQLTAPPPSVKHWSTHVGELMSQLGCAEKLNGRRHARLGYPQQVTRLECAPLIYLL